MSSIPKKTLAVVFAADDKYAFALGAAILSLKENSPKLFKAAEFFVFTNNMSPANCATLQDICPVTFKEFRMPFDPSEIPTLKTYTELTLARYECFFMLDIFKSVLWLDIDILVQAELWPIIEAQDDWRSDGGWGMALARDLNLFAFNFFSSPGKKYTLDWPNFNAGIFLLDDTLPNYKEKGRWCYETTKKLAPKLRFPDQAVLNMLPQHFGLEVALLSAIYNAQPFSSPVRTKKAIILHAMGPHKFWNNFPLAKWDKYYKQWIALGGGRIPPQKINNWVKFCFKTKLIIENIPILWGILRFFNNQRFKRLNNKFLKEIMEKR